MLYMLYRGYIELGQVHVLCLGLDRIGCLAFLLYIFTMKLEKRMQKHSVHIEEKNQRIPSHKDAFNFLKLEAY